MLQKNVAKVLITLFKKKDIDISEVAKEINLSAMGALKIVKKLETENIVTITRIGRSSLVRLNKKLDNLELFSMAEKYNFEEFINKHKNLAGFLKQLKRELSGKVDFCLIFGSYASGEETKQSDLDLLIVADRKPIKSFNKVSVLANIDISPVFVSKDTFMKQVLNKHRLYREIVEGKRVLVCGEYDFWRMLLELER